MRMIQSRYKEHKDVINSNKHFKSRGLTMKKILAVVLSAVAVNSFADVTLYGRVSAAIENDAFPQSNMQEPTTTSIQNYGSYFGIRGSDQVIGQTAVIWQVEQFLDITSGQPYQNTSGSNWVPGNPNGAGAPTGANTSAINVLASSDTYIGLQGDWGRFRIGNLSNTYRTNTGSVDIYNGNNNANAFGTYDRFMRVLPQAARYDSTTWSNFSFSAYISANEDGNFNTGGINGNGMGGSNAQDENGYTGNPIWGLGLSYNPGNFSATWNLNMAPNTGMYKGFGGAAPGIGTNGQAVPFGINAYSTRLELGYNNPDSWFVGLGGQIAQGYGYQSQAGNGNMGNIWVQKQAIGGINSAYYNDDGLVGQNWYNMNQAVLSTAELGASFGWHINNWTPKIGYMYGANTNAGAINPFNIIAGKNGIAGTGYQQVVGELDWNITPRTIAFVSSGYQYWGNTAQNMVKGAGTKLQTQDMNEAGGSMYTNNVTTAVGFSHTF